MYGQYSIAVSNQERVIVASVWYLSCIFSLDFRAVNGVPGDDSPAEKISFVYIPSLLYHNMFELIKNSMRSTSSNMI